MIENQYLTETEKNDVLASNIAKSNMGVPLTRQRFPHQADGVPVKVTLISSRSGMFHNIGFAAGMENTVNAGIADKLLDDFPDIMKYVAINGHRVNHGRRMDEKERIKSEIVNELKQDYDLVPKNQPPKPTARQRVDETKLSQPEQQKK